MDLEEIKAIPVVEVADKPSHLYLWVPNALLKEGMEVMSAWGFQYKTNLIWHKIRKDGGPDGRGVGFYFRNVTEVILFGVRSEEHTSELQSLMRISYAVFCLKQIHSNMFSKH